MIKQQKSLQQIIEICQNSGFVAGKVHKNLVKNVQFLPFGSILSENLLREWQNVDRNVNVYFQRDSSKRLCSGDSLNYFRNRELHAKIDVIKKYFQFEIPFGVAENLTQNSVDDALAENEIGFGIKEKTVLSCTHFIPSDERNEMFYKIQRQTAMQTVSVKSKFHFGNIELEKLELIPYGCFAPKLKFLEELKKVTSVTPSIIRSSMVLEIGTLATLLDAVDTGVKSEINFHRRIPPYQCSVFAVTDQSNIIEMQDLAKYVTSLLRRSNISTLNAPKCLVSEATALNVALEDMDKLGVPYGILLDENSLKSGLIQLRNRDTTISETIHLSDVPDYLLKIFRS